METERLKLLINNAFPYIKDCSKVHMFYNTCVPDSFLAALHTSYLKYSKIEALLKSDDHLRKVMSLFNEKKYNEARELFVNKLNPSTDDLHSNVKDYFPLIDQLVRAKILFTDEPPSDKPIFSALGKCGDVMVLGDLTSPTLILVHRDVNNDLHRDCKSTELPAHVDDENKRMFTLQFLMIGKEKHMTMCFQSDRDDWHLYDNDQKQPSFQPFDLQSLKDYIICLVGYVNETQEQECKLAIPETGDTAGAWPFCSSARSPIPSEEDMEVDPSNIQYRIAIAETSSLGSRPIQNNPEVLSKPSNQTHQVEDVEMPSCSSSDSD